MAEYYEDNYYSNKRQRFPWAIVIVLMALAAVGGGWFSYYLADGSRNEQTAAIKQEIMQDIAAQNNSRTENNTIPAETVTGLTETVLSPKAVEALLDHSSSGFVLDLIYGEVSDIYDKVSPSVVGISNIINYSSIYNGFGGFRLEQSEQEIEQSSGSGVIYTADGYIITNYHVINGADRLKVTLYDGSVEEATVIGSDQRTDLALIKIDRKNLTPVRLGDSSKLRVGDFSMAIGNPGGENFSRSLTTGTVSGLNRVVSTAEGLQLTMIQTDAAINPGNSGGALVNSKGELIGINTVKIANTNYEGMGFAIPVNTVKEIISDLMKYNKVIRPGLGVNMLRNVDSIFAQYNRLSVDYGVLIAPLEDSNADKAGIKEYDIIIAIDGEKITSSTSLQNIIFSHKIGDKVTVTVYRYTTDENIDIEVELGEL